MGDLIKKYLEKIPGLKQGNKKIIEYLIIIIAIGVLIIFAANLITPGETNGTKKGATYTAKVESQKNSNEPNYKMEQRLARILADIRGVGRVSVMITYSSGPESVLARQEKSSQTNSSEKDSAGGERKTAQNNLETSFLMADEQGGLKEPIVIRQVASKILGVIVVAEGGDNSTVKGDIAAAVEAATGIPEYRIKVFKRN